MQSLVPTIASIVSLIPASSASYSTSATDRFIYDADGRATFFHGTNFVQKGPPWYPEVLLDVENIKDMQSWGFNTARVGVMWSGVEPEMGVYNETYIDTIRGILDDLQDHGIYALIDVHQDVLSSYFCEYDGAPTWLVDLSTSSTHEFPWPLPGECSDRPWGSNYLAEETGAAFQDLYDNVNGMRDHFAQFWGKVASSLKDKDILGYEIINEPWAGNIYAQPSLLLPGEAGSKNLQPLYDAISAAIRTEDPDHIVFYEPVTWGMIFNGTISGSGFTHVPGGYQYADKSVFSFHYYCWWFDSSSPSVLQKRTCDERFGPQVFDQAVEEARVLGGSAMLTEWGQGCDPTNGADAQCDPIMDMADERLVSWIDWYWTGPLMNGWDATDEAVAIYSRSFAKSVAGTPTKMKYDRKTLHFELCYIVDPAITSPTVIYGNFDVHYDNGVNVVVSGSAADYLDVSVGAQPNEITMTYTGDGSALALDTCVNVYPKRL